MMALRRSDERGAVTIIVALLMTTLLVITAMVLDFGLVRIDRQVDRSAADAATLAGLQGLDAGDGTPHPYQGVCTAVRYLKVNSTRFSGINETTGWKNGLGSATASGCSNIALRAKQCTTDKSTWARWDWTGTSRGVTVSVTIQSGYDLAAPSNKWLEDDLPATKTDLGATDDSSRLRSGCDNLAVTIRQSRKPGLGSLATSSDLTTAIRSVGRVKAVPGDSAPAMLLLKRTGCPVLKTGSNGGASFIRVRGAISASGKTQAGTIHSDSDGLGCLGDNNGWIYGGLAPNGIVAYAAPLAANPLSPDPTKPGLITSVASANGLSGSPVRDGLSHVYGSSELSAPAVGTRTEVSGRTLVTRRLIDERYLPGVRAAMGGANSMFAAGASGRPDVTWKVLDSSTASNPCKPTSIEMTVLNLTASDSLYIDCPGKFIGDGGAGNTIIAGRVYFRGTVSAAGSVKLPNARHVYIGNHQSLTSAIDLGSGGTFEVNTSNVDLATGKCAHSRSPNKSVLFVRSGRISLVGSSMLRMCRTTALMMGGQTTPSATPPAGPGCVPLTNGTAPTATPCNGQPGTGHLHHNGGSMDWTPPNSLDAVTDPATGDPLPAALDGWADVNGLEDLAFWSESAGGINDFRLGGGSGLSVRGVFMVPNADSFSVAGGSSYVLTNAQFIVSSLELNGTGTSVDMSVDADSGVALPDQALVGLVR